MSEKNNYLSRKDFIKLVGGAAAFGFLYPCLGSCTKMKNPPPPVDLEALKNSVDFTIDLSAQDNTALQNIGGFVVIDNEYVIARDELGNYIAATRNCSHEPYKKIVWHPGLKQWLCLEHQATFDKTGVGTTTYNNNGANGLKIYNTELVDPQTLRIYG